MAGRNLFAEELTDQPTGRNLFEPEEFTEPDQNPVLGGMQSALQGATLGFSDEIQSVIASLVATPFITDETLQSVVADLGKGLAEDFMQNTKEARESLRSDQAKFAEENPGTDLALQLAGGLTTGGLGGAGKVAGAKTLGQAALQSAKTGATIGTAAGAGFADADDFFSQETLEEAAKTGTLGAALGGLTPVVIKGAVSAGKLIPKALPESMMQTAVKFRPGFGTKNTDKAIRTMLDEGIMPTTNGLELIGKKLSTLDKGLNKIIDDATEKGALITKKALFVELKQLRKDLGGVNLRSDKNLQQINTMAKNFDQSLKRINKPRLTPREVQDLKRSAYRQLRFDVSQQSGNFAQIEAEKGIIRGAKKSLEKIDPNVKGINQREGALLQLGEELEKKVGVLDNRNFVSLDTAAKIAAGAATGTPAGTAAGVGAAGLGAPRVKARTALILENIRKISEIESANKTLSPELAAAFSILVEDNKEALNELIDE